MKVAYQAEEARTSASFGLTLFALSVWPASIGHQDLAALMARQTRDRATRPRLHAGLPFGTIHAATFSFPQPVGALIPDPPTQLASYGASDANRALTDAPTGRRTDEYPARSAASKATCW